MKQEKYVVIIGGLNLDIAGLSGKNYKEHDSNIGKITTHAGGVGHNIAINLTKYEVPTYLITVYGDDYFGTILQNECSKTNINLDYAEKVSNTSSSTYLYVTDNKGDMVTAINDMEIVNYITPKFLESRLSFINSAELCVIDANLSEESIKWLSENVEIPIFAEPVSCAKAGRFVPILSKIDTIKPNEFEAEIYTGIKITNIDTAISAAKKIVEKGVENVFISLGSKGIIGADKNSYYVVEPIKGEVVSTNGAGDCTMATITWSRYNFGKELSVEEVCQFSQAAARLTVESKESVSKKLNVTNVVKLANKEFGGKNND